MVFSSSISRPKLQSAVLKWFVDEDFCFVQETALANCAAALSPVGLLDIGLVVGMAIGAVAVAAPVFAGTGNGVLTRATPAASGSALVGDYKVRFEAAVADGGDFIVVRPDGTEDGVGKVGTAYVGDVKFTIADGATDFVVGDNFTLSVSGVGKVVPLNLSGTDGSQIAAGVVIRQATVPSGADAPVVLLRRGPAILLSDGLIWPSGATTAQQNNAKAQLLARGMVVRDS